MSTPPLEGVGSLNGVETISPAVLDTPGRVAWALHLAIGTIEKAKALDGPFDGALAGSEGAALAWRWIGDRRHTITAQPFDDSRPAIRFRSTQAPEAPALVVDHEGNWHRGEASGEVTTLGELRDVADNEVREEAVAFFSMATLVLERSRDHHQPPTPASA